MKRSSEQKGALKEDPIVMEDFNAQIAQMQKEIIQLANLYIVEGIELKVVNSFVKKELDVDSRQTENENQINFKLFKNTNLFHDVNVMTHFQFHSSIDARLNINFIPIIRRVTFIPSTLMWKYF